MTKEVVVFTLIVETKPKLTNISYACPKNRPTFEALVSKIQF